MQLIDSHCHLDASLFDGDRAEVIARAQAAGVIAQIVPALTAAGWPKLRAVCRSRPNLFPAYGLHPMFVAEHRPAHLDDLGQWVERERPVAIGECGLDYFVAGLDQDMQRLYFEAQLTLARAFGLPVIVHARRALDVVIASIRKIGGLHGVVHSFSGSLEQAQRLWQAGFLLGFGGALTYPRAQRLRRVVAAMPLEALLLETDAPDQPDAAIRRQRNEPARLAVILATVAELRQQPIAEIARATTSNAMALFKLPPLACDPASHRASVAAVPTPCPLPQMQMRR